MKTTVKTMKYNNLNGNERIFALINVTDINAFAENADGALPVFGEYAELDGEPCIIMQGASKWTHETIQKSDDIKRFLAKNHVRFVSKTAVDWVLEGTNGGEEVSATDLDEAMVAWGAEPVYIEDEEDCESWAEAINGATRRGYLFPWDGEEFEIAKEQLGLQDNEVRVIHTFVNGNAGLFCLSENYK